MRNDKVLMAISFTVYLFSCCAAAGDPLAEALKLQNKTINKEIDLLKIENSKKETASKINAHLQVIFFKYYNKVKNSEMKLSNARKVVGDFNASRRRSGDCCDILISSSKDDDMYLITKSGDGLFAIDGYGLQSVFGEIHDLQFDQAGTFSNKCKYEVSISFTNSRTYSCDEFMSGKIDDKVIRDMLEMLPVAMKNYLESY